MQHMRRNDKPTVIVNLEHKFWPMESLAYSQTNETHSLCTRGVNKGVKPGSNPLKNL